MPPNAMQCFIPSTTARNSSLNLHPLLPYAGSLLLGPGNRQVHWRDSSFAPGASLVCLIEARYSAAGRQFPGGLNLNHLAPSLLPTGV
jgi:hypothetical protein